MTSHDSQLSLARGYALETTDERLTLRAPDGRMCLTIVLHPDGPIVEVAAASLAVTTAGDLRIDAGRLDVHTREGLSLHSNSDIELHAKAAIATTAFEQRLTATHGDIRVQANDDVRIDGELIHLNAPEPHEGHGAPRARNDER